MVLKLWLLPNSIQMFQHPESVILTIFQKYHKYGAGDPRLLSREECAFSSFLWQFAKRKSAWISRANFLMSVCWRGFHTHAVLRFGKRLPPRRTFRLRKPKPSSTASSSATTPRHGSWSLLATTRSLIITAAMDPQRHDFVTHPASKSSGHHPDALSALSELRGLYCIRGYAPVYQEFSRSQSLPRF